MPRSPASRNIGGGKRAADDELSGAQTAADRRRHVGDMAHDGTTFADVGLEIGGDGDILAAAGDAALEPVEAGAAAIASRGPRITWRWKMSPARTAATSSSARSISASSMAGPSAAIAWRTSRGRRQPTGRGRYKRRSRPPRPACASRRTTPAPEGSCARSSRKPTIGAVRLHLASSAGAPKPTFQPICLAPSSRCSRASPSARACHRRCADLERLAHEWPSGRIFVAGRLDRSRAHPAPDQHHVLVRRVVEAVPEPRGE